MKRFLFVCTGNTCRSPMAEALLRHKTKDSIEVKSAGMNAFPGSEASSGTRAVLREKGINFEHSASLIDDQLVQWADVILTMTGNHKRVLQQHYPLYAGKVYTLKEFVHEGSEVGKTQKKLDQLYTELEIAQAQFVADHQEEIDRLKRENTKDARTQLEHLDHKLSQKIQPQRKAIEELLQEAPNYDVLDPFGGSVEIYRETAEEIEQLIDQIIQKHINK